MKTLKVKHSPTQKELVNDILLNNEFFNIEFYELVKNTLSRLPPRVLEKLTSMLPSFWLMVEGSLGMAKKVEFECRAKHNIRKKSFNFNNKKVKSSIAEPIKFIQWVVIVSQHDLKKLSQPARIALVAHEIAHVYLEHDWIPQNESADSMEKETDELVIKWGLRKVLKALRKA